MYIDHRSERLSIIELYRGKSKENYAASQEEEEKKELLNKLRREGNEFLGAMMNVTV